MRFGEEKLSGGEFHGSERWRWTFMLFVLSI